ncbi:MAG: hypothetical protein IPN79_05015 [Saprospiraceae bacterium]|nr:hypothetical protein [Saprospiraceae bacterium]
MISKIMLLLFAVFVFGCEKTTETIDTNILGQQYFPLKTGKYWIYESDSVILRGGGTIRDTLHGYIKEEVHSSFINGSGDTVFNVHVYFKRKLDDTFTYYNTVFISRLPNMVLRQEDNLLFTKLVFPLKTGLRFNHNQLFDQNIDVMVGGETFLDMYSEWNTRIESYNEVYNWAGDLLKRTRIRLVDEETSLDKKYYYEEYLENIGLYKKEMIFLQDNKGGTIPLPERAIRGFYHNLLLLESN